MPGGMELTVFPGVVYDTPAPRADRELVDIRWRDFFVVYRHTAVLTHGASAIKDPDGCS